MLNKAIVYGACVYINKSQFEHLEHWVSNNGHSESSVLYDQCYVHKRPSCSKVNYEKVTKGQVPLAHLWLLERSHIVSELEILEWHLVQILDSRENKKPMAQTMAQVSDNNEDGESSVPICRSHRLAYTSERRHFVKLEEEDDELESNIGGNESQEKN
ncbi:hypothetical protein BDC45DRAFT_571902 [Circinella umbellata]|nr:hypothetical protein BDC45DRAFT_571902 [Circinella umbellata]